MSVCKVIKVHPHAVLPHRANFSDAGFDLSVISKIKDISAHVSLYDTGLQLQIPKGYYAEIHARSSLVKNGFKLANSVGIIDQGYRGNLMIMLEDANHKFKHTFEYPFRCCQLIFKRMEEVEFEEIEKAADDFHDTDRGVGSFGSTGQ